MSRRNRASSSFSGWTESSGNQPNGSLRRTRTFERVKYGKVQHGSQQTPASGDTNSRKGRQVAGIRLVTAAPLDQESPGSSPGGATRRSSTTSVGRAFLFLRPLLPFPLQFLRPMTSRPGARPILSARSFPYCRPSCWRPHKTSFDLALEEGAADTEASMSAWTCPTCYLRISKRLIRPSSIRKIWRPILSNTKFPLSMARS